MGYVQCAGYVWWIRLKWIYVGYVKCAGYVRDMCGVRYANNLLKNPATKRLSGIRFFSSCHSDESAIKNSGSSLVYHNINNLNNKLEYIYLLNYKKKYLQ